ncbi:PRK06851 family protein [Fuchsiella alkaliacetigena]|uniref:PRK06851 family protein n=1 Tax=Fuchsiella alkaliacetigena TaxID=957042 RepID=UPI00200A8DCA|nr:PRK06851 family protein [Fuchsiella alkaliacetigena]MCK8824920.1 PRK06851 family protein [Fuchsiella alkaliacetigena]
MAKGNIINLFSGGNTAQGFCSFYEYLPHQAEDIFIIKGGPGTGKSTFIRKIGEKMVEAGFDIEFHWCSSDNNSLDGVVIKKLKVAILDGTAPHLVDPKNPGAVDRIINFGRHWNEKLLKEYKKEIQELNNQISISFQKAYDYLAIAKLTYDQWQNYYIEATNWQKVEAQLNKLKNEIFGNKKVTAQKGEVRRLFASALTPQGSVNYLDSITAQIDNRYILKGKPGTGKSDLASEIGNTALKKGYQVNFFHCAFDPESIDTVVIPELSTALIDGSPPHQLQNEREEDIIINMLNFSNAKIINQSKTEILDVEKRYHHLVSQATAKISTAKQLHDKLEDYYIKAMDFEAINRLRKKIIKKILKKAT